MKNVKSLHVKSKLKEITSFTKYCKKRKKKYILLQIVGNYLEA